MTPILRTAVKRCFFWHRSGFLGALGSNCMARILVPILTYSVRSNRIYKLVSTTQGGILGQWSLSQIRRKPPETLSALSIYRHLWWYDEMVHTFQKPTRRQTHVPNKVSQILRPDRILARHIEYNHPVPFCTILVDGGVGGSWGSWKHSRLNARRASMFKTGAVAPIRPRHHKSRAQGLDTTRNGDTPLEVLEPSIIRLR